MRTLFTSFLALTAASAAWALPSAAGEGCCRAAAAGNPASWSGEKSDIVDTAVAAGDFGTLAAALKAAGLVDALKGEGPFTVFAPTDAAFAKLPDGTLESLLKPENREALQGILTYHVVAGELPASKVTSRRFAQTLNGQRISFALRGDEVVVDEARVTQADVRASNGVIHVIDSVLLPAQDDLVETATAAGDFTTLAKALQAAGLVEALQGEGPFTVFAPTDAAFAKLPEGTLETLLKPENRDRLASVLKYHVVSGRVYSDQALEAGSAATLQGGKLRIRMDGEHARVGAARLVKTDLEASNGVIHVVDEVLLPE